MDLKFKPTLEVEMALNEQQLRRMTETLIKQRLSESLKPVFQGIGEMAKTMGDTTQEQSDVRLDSLGMVGSLLIEILDEQRKRAKVKISQCEGSAILSTRDKEDPNRSGYFGR